MKSILAAGTEIEYLDTGGPGPTVVLLHGLLMDETLWTEVVSGLQDSYRCVVPVLPLGAHRQPLGSETSPSVRGMTEVVRQFLAALDLRDVTLVGNDTGGAIAQVLITDGEDRVGRLVLVSCDAFGNFPPGATGKTLFLLGKLPPALFGAFMQQMRMKPMRRMPISFGWLTKRGDKTVSGWVRSLLARSGTRNDAVAVLRAMNQERGLLDEVADKLKTFDRPALVVWAEKDRVMPPEHGRRLADLLPQGRLVEIADSYTLVPLDQPKPLVEAIRAFVPTR